MRRTHKPPQYSQNRIELMTRWQRRNNRCDVQACGSTYKSFRAADCTYQPFDGPRRVCGKAPEQRADREQSDEPQRRSLSRREDLRDSREVDRRTRWRVYEDDDDADDVVLFRRSRRW